MSTSRSRSSTPTLSLAAGRRSRSTRAVRATTQSSRAGSTRGSRGRDSEGGSRIRFNINQAPARKWTEVMRPPAEGVKFLIPKWVPIEKLTEKEREVFMLSQPPVNHQNPEEVWVTESVEAKATIHEPQHENPASVNAANVSGTANETADSDSAEPPTKRVRLEIGPAATSSAEAPLEVESQEGRGIISNSSGTGPLPVVDQQNTQVANDVTAETTTAAGEAGAGTPAKIMNPSEGVIESVDGAATNTRQSQLNSEQITSELPKEEEMNI